MKTPLGSMASSYYITMLLLLSPEQHSSQQSSSAVYFSTPLSLGVTHGRGRSQEKVQKSFRPSEGTDFSGASEEREGSWN